VNPPHDPTSVIADGEMETLQRVINARLAHHPAEDLIVAYCYTLVEMRSYASEIGGVIFYGRVGWRWAVWRGCSIDGQTVAR
jgi:hypothetical protein